MSFLSSLFGLNSQTDKSIMVLNASAFKDAINNKKVQLIDVRTASEYQSGHIKNAKNIDFFASSFANQVSKLNKDKAIYIYCRSGSRSKQSAKKLSAMGFKEIYDLKNGYLGYN